MGKKSKRSRNSTTTKLGRREAIKARHGQQQNILIPDPRAEADQLRDKFLLLSTEESNGRSARGISLVDFERHDILVRYDDLQKVVFGEWLKSDSDEVHYKAMNFATKEDYSFLKAIYRNKNENLILRARAINILGELACYSRIDGDASLCMQLSIKLCNEAVATGIPKDFAFPIQKRCMACLELWRRSAEDYPSKNDVITHAGDQCDRCGKLVDEFGVDFMACCGRCKLTYYCSVECQQEDWKGGHSHQCRKKKEFYVGDTALFVGLGSPMRFEMEVTLVAPIKWCNQKDKAEKWFVSDIPCEKFCVVPTETLRRRRPVTWWDFQGHKDKHLAGKACAHWANYMVQAKDMRDKGVSMPTLHDADRFYKYEGGQLMCNKEGGEWKIVLVRETIWKTSMEELDKGQPWESVQDFKAFMMDKYLVDEWALDCLFEKRDGEEDSEKEDEVLAAMAKTDTD